MGRLGSTYACQLCREEVWEDVVKIALDDVDVGGDGTKKVVSFAVGDVPSANCLLDFAWDEELLEFGGQGGGARRDVNVSDY